MKKPDDPQERLKKLEAKALDILAKKKDVYFFCDLAVEMGYSYQWLYEIGLDKVESVKNALIENKKGIKRGLRNKWYMNDNATTQVALYRLLADDDELTRLNNSKVEVTGAGGSPLTPPVINILPVKTESNKDEE